MSGSGSTFNSLISNATNDENRLPPVEKWDPPYCGELNIEIKPNGDWYHDNSLIERKKLYKLFSTILIKQKNDFYLVTPVEKVKIKVQWQPFVITDFEIVESELGPCYRFTDNCDNQVVLENKQQLDFSNFKQLDLPIIKIRRNLWASFSRNCYYRLIEQADIASSGDKQQVQINSAGQTFCLGVIEE